MTNQNKLRMCAWLIAGLIWSAASGLTWAQTERGNSAIPNGDLENWSEEQPTAWSFISADGALIKPETEAFKQGQYAALIDATQEKIKGNSFSNLMQSIAAEPWRGKKVRLKAWIKTGQLTGAARAQMWLRVDLAATTDKSDETPAAGAFDNMDQRPIRNDEWQQVEIVLPVAETADRLALGVFLIGQGQVWVDDVSLEAVPDDTPSTSSQTVSSEPRFQLPPVVMKAFQEADKAPRQPFFTPWLWVALLAMAIFFAAMFGPVPRRREAVDMDSGVVPQSLLRKFCMHVTVCYWLLYCLPSAVGTLAGLGIGFLGTVAGWIEQGKYHDCPRIGCETVWY